MSDRLYIIFPMQCLVCAIKLTDDIAILIAFIEYLIIISVAGFIQLTTFQS